ncbi:hypothetical protein IMG5_097960 [Ichthyophthirius multifiliis]|uniref:Fatty acid desaturase domain-containing protein n=1 Tax=Ichthyophthirius multifiliis TaxID=5932 RepID=G0QRV8_ICHMU|nr:hypothetical protein IMG5_097960 [Ichthyophthirius multifiliis]EGR32049.1 hypothetical protein IMG5_097960 [Ichthyophthirius multifiliis]|eukprot:XP_004035535.1 hypothetical protein IMG5_097960 [Ichthyophthirius multifiliis]
MTTLEIIDNITLFSSFQYYMIPLLYPFAFIAFKYLKQYFFFILIVYTVIPYCDHFFPLDLKNPTKEEIKKLTGKIKYRIPLYLSVVLDWLFTFWCIDYICINREKLSYLQQFGIIFSVSNAGTSNINVAHELFHKDRIQDKILGYLTLAKNLYMHFAIEHIQGHHKNVATHKDAATSRLNQSLYEFLPQTLIGTYKNAWNIENEQQIFKIYGYYGGMLFLFQSFVSVVYLEMANYVEHYGLVRKEISPGVYEPVNIKFSWNAPHRVSNYLLFKIQRHSDHHENSYKEYQTLCSYDESPQLPHGYTVCVLMALFPKIWFKIMNKQLKNYQKEGKNIIDKEIQDEVWKFIQKLTIGLFVLSIISVYL